MNVNNKIDNDKDDNKWNNENFAVIDKIIIIKKLLRLRCKYKYKNKNERMREVVRKWKLVQMWE